MTAEAGQPRPAARGSRRTMGGVAGIGLLLVLWAEMAASQPEIILPSPRETSQALMVLASDGTLFSSLGITLFRAATGVLIALAIGLLWGGVCGLSSWAEALSRPAVSALMAVPPVVLVSLGLIWFGPGDGVTRLVILLVALPLVVITVQEAIRNIDPRLTEMAATFRLPWRIVFRHVVAPAVASPVLAATVVTFGQSIRVTVMGELLSATNGIGAKASQAQTNLDTAKIFAWTITIVAVVIALENLVLRPLTDRLLRWRNTSDDVGAAEPVAAGRG